MLKLFISGCFVIIQIYSTLSVQGQGIEFPSDRRGRAKLLDGTSVDFKRISFNNDTATCLLKNNITLNYPSDKIYSLELRKTRVVEMTLAFTGLGLTLGLLSAYALNKTAADDMKKDFILMYTTVFAGGGFILGISLPKYKAVYIKDQVQIQWQPGLLYSSLKSEVYAGIKVVIYVNPYNN